MKERRHYKRYFVEFKDIHGKILFSSNIQILNISVGGVAFTIDKRLNIGGIYVLRLESKGKALHLRGTIMWSRLSEERKQNGETIRIHTVGMKFKSLGIDRLNEIETFIKENVIDYQRSEGFSPSMSGVRIHVRFHIKDPDKATISCDEDFSVKKISQSGMLIDSYYVFQPNDSVPMAMTLLEGQDIAFWARIVSCKDMEDTEPKHYEIGIEFLDMSDTDRGKLGAFIASIEDRQENR